MRDQPTSELVPGVAAHSLQRLVRRHLWRVVYDCVFESSTGMKRYSIPHENLECYVATETADVNAVRREIQAVKDNQTTVTKIRTAQWLGEMINAS